MYYIGIDNGVKGGIVVLDKDQKIIAKTVMPVLGKTKKQFDILKILEFLKVYSKDSVTALEKAQPRYRDGSKQAFKTGLGYGILQGVLNALQMEYIIVAPKIWQKSVFKGLDSTDTKVASIMFCKRRWLKEDWTATKRSEKAHDGITDAACLAYYLHTKLK